MPWARFDDQLHAHPKVIALGPVRLPALGLQLMACCWSNAYLTDGYIPARVATQLAGESDGSALVDELLRVGMWERDEHRNGFRIHDFLKYNLSRRKVLALRKKNSHRQRMFRKQKRNAVSNGVRNAVSNGPVTHVPTRASTASSSSKKKLSDTEFLAELKAEPGYQGIDLDRELSKCRVWTRSRGRQATRRTFIAWLNRIERPLAEAGVPEGEEI